MSKFREMWDKVLKEKLIANTNIGGVDLSLNDKGRLSAKGKIGSTNFSADSDGHVQATGKIAGGTMSTAVNKDGDGGTSFTNKKGRTVSHTAGDRDAWVSPGPNQISKRVPLNNNRNFAKSKGINANKNKDGSRSVNMKIGPVDTTTDFDADGKGSSTTWKHNDFELKGKVNNGNSRVDVEYGGNRISSARNKDGSTGSTIQTKRPWHKGGGYETISQTKGSDDVWYSPGPNQISKKLTQEHPMKKIQQNEYLNNLRKNAGLVLKEHALDELAEEELIEAPTGYDKVNISRYRRAKKAGTLGNTGPINPDGTSFSPNRWDKYADMAAEQDADDDAYYRDEIGIADPNEYVPADYADEVGEEDPDAVYADVAKAEARAEAEAEAELKAKALARVARAQADEKEDKRAEWDMNRADDQFDNLDLEYQAVQQANANRAQRLAAAKAKAKGKITDINPLDTPPLADKDLSAKQLQTRRKVQDKYDLDKDLDVYSQEDDLLVKANKGKDLKFKPNPKNFKQEFVKPDPNATDTDDFGNPLQTTDDFGNYGYDERVDKANHQLNHPNRLFQNDKRLWPEDNKNNLQFNSKENYSTPVNEEDEMDRWLRIAGLK
jgi:hypothetical protein